jgi:predicted dienelactone hydrolase
MLALDPPLRTLACLWGLLASAHAGDALNAGYRKASFDHTGGDGAKRTTAVFLWHPTTSPAAPFVYTMQKGVAVENAPVAPGRHPLIVFSHGYLGAGDQTLFLMEALARAGYIVAAPNHQDALTARSGPRERPGFLNPEGWTDKKFADRKEDIQHLLDHLLALDAQAGSFLHGHVDRRAIGGAGHSLGGYTMLGLAGAWESWREERIRAVLLVSPFAQPFLTNGALEHVRVPVMLQGGTLDVSITPFLDPIYRRLSAPKYFVTLDKATHFEWTNLISMQTTTTEIVKSGNAKLITDYSVAFFDRYLRGREPQATLEDKAATLSNYQHVK